MATAATVKASAPSATAVDTNSFFKIGFFIGPRSSAIREMMRATAKSAS
jgi:hypothetical protein